MLGAIVGDIVGSRFEFNPTNNYDFELFTDECSYTDDTICTIAVADALLQEKDYGECIHAWCRKYPHPMGGYGGRFAGWVASDTPQPYGSFGNGSAMRVSPIGWWCTAQEVIMEAKISAACTHNHELGIKGAIAVATAIQGCYEQRRNLNGQPLTAEQIDSGLDYARELYFGQDPIELDIKQYRNKFDETCQGTVPVALWIVRHSKGFEDAIRQAVSLGADADTLGAIVGSIAEALWGIPEWIKVKALSYLPQEMKDVVSAFHKRVKRLHKLTKRCEYYKVGELNRVKKEHLQAYESERAWAQFLAGDYERAENIKAQMVQAMPLNRWQELADEYDLPLTLMGIFLFYVCQGEFSKEQQEMLDKFLDANYKHVTGEKKDALEHRQRFKALMLWKLGLGNMAKLFNGEDPIPSKETVPDEKMIKELLSNQHSDDEFSDLPLDIPVSSEDMDILRKGHIPEAQEDHWVMFTDDEYIRYYRSWTKKLAFEAHYCKSADGYRIDNLRMNHALAEFGVNGDEASAWLFRYLVAAEIGADSYSAWHEYLDAWEKLHKMYLKKS